MSEEYGEIKVSKEIIKKIEEHIKDSDFESVEEYVTFILEEVLKDEEEPEEVYSKEDEKIVKERLKALGYLG